MHKLDRTWQRFPTLPTWLLLGVALAGTACGAKLSGNLTVDGKAFELKSCRSGQVNDFVGVDLVAADGTMLRLTMQPSGQAMAYVFAGGSASGDEVGDCGPLTVTRQSSAINDIQNVMGSAELDCSGPDHAVKGSVLFENCH